MESLAKVKLTPLIPPMRGELILLPLRFGDGWGGVSRIYARGLMLTVIGYNSELTALLFPVAYLYLKLLVGLVRLSEIKSVVFHTQ